MYTKIHYVSINKNSLSNTSTVTIFIFSGLRLPYRLAVRLLRSRNMSAQTIALKSSGRCLSSTTTNAAFHKIRSIGWVAAGLAGVGSVLPSWLLSLEGTDATTTRRYVMGLFCLAIVQLTLSRMILIATSSRSSRRSYVVLSALGVTAYAAGTLLAPIVRNTAWLMPLGSVAMLSCIVLNWLQPVSSWSGQERRILSGLMLAGIALDGSLVLASLMPTSVWANYLGPADALRFRLLALARVAAMTLPALALLHQETARRHVFSTPSTCWSCLGLHAGAILMPSVLCLAAVIHSAWKYLLPVPALMIFFGVCGAAGMARPLGFRAEQSGWFLIALSMSVGLLMGLYAFDGPLPSPALVGAYGDVVRTIARQSHGLAITAGILIVFLARQRRTDITGGHS